MTAARLMHVHDFYDSDFYLQDLFIPLKLEESGCSF